MAFTLLLRVVVLLLLLLMQHLFVVFNVVFAFLHVKRLTLKEIEFSGVTAVDLRFEGVFLVEFFFEFFSASHWSTWAYGCVVCAYCLNLFSVVIVIIVINITVVVVVVTTSESVVVGVVYVWFKCAVSKLFVLAFTFVFFVSLELLLFVEFVLFV